MKICKVTLTMALCFFSLLSVGFISHYFRYTPLSFHDPDRLLSPSILVVSIAVLLMPIAIVFVSHSCVLGARLRALGFQRSFWMNILKGLGAGLILKSLATTVAFVCSPGAFITPALEDVTFTSWLPFFLWFVLALILSSFNGELAYRAFPLSHLFNGKRLHDHFWIWAASAFFSAIYFLISPADLGHFLYRLAFGVLAGVLFYRTRSLGLIVGLHAGWSFIALAVSPYDWHLGTLFTLNRFSDSADLMTNIALPLIAYAVVARFGVRSFMPEIPLTGPNHGLSPTRPNSPLPPGSAPTFN